MTTDDTSEQACNQVLITARTYDDYLQLFALEPGDLLNGPVLDCPAGASDFGATVRSIGGTCTSADVLYDQEPDELAATINAAQDRVRRWVAGQPNRFRFTGNGDWEHDRRWQNGARHFIDDYTSNRSAGAGNYVAAILPELPFPDRSFTLVVSGSLLFSYSDKLDLNFHLMTIKELIRVCRGQVRIHPLNDRMGNPYPALPELVAYLKELGVDAHFRLVHSDIDPRDNSTLILDLTHVP